jgi:N-acetylmuramoyl-L-alanine amidase
VQLTWRLSALLATGLLATACGAATAGGSGTAAHGAASKAASQPNVAANADTAPAAGGLNATPAAKSSSGGTGGALANGPASTRPLAGKTVGIDPGHNGRNKDDPSYINKQIWNGREWESCDTTGTETDGGYTEARYNFNVATFLRADLVKLGARVVMTRKNNNGVGPCVTRRARILNRAHSNVAVDIHADGGPASGRGFTVLQPVADGPNNKVITSSVRFGHDVRAAMLKYTRMPKSNYYGHDGLIFRNDLAGLNLATEPKILIETGNMRNATDARLLTRTWFQKRIARALTAAIVTFLTRR